MDQIVIDEIRGLREQHAIGAQQAAETISNAQQQQLLHTRLRDQYDQVLASLTTQQ